MMKISSSTQNNVMLLFTRYYPAFVTSKNKHYQRSTLREEERLDYRSNHFHFFLFLRIILIILFRASGEPCQHLYKKVCGEASR